MRSRCVARSFAMTERGTEQPSNDQGATKALKRRGILAAAGGVAVTQRCAEGFVVTERNKGTSSGTFSYRIVAKRADIKGERLARFEMPKINHPDPNTLPRPVTPAKL